MRRPVALSLALSVLLSLSVAAPAVAVTAEIWFPVQVTDGVVLHDNYGDCRSGCARTHRGVDITGPQMTPVYAAEDGYIRRAYGGDSRDCFTEACSSYGFLVYGDDGNSYFYLHLNNDTPRRPEGCDQRGGPANAFSPRLVDVLEERGTLEPLPRSSSSGNVVRVSRGEHIGYVGSSGNAGCGTDHLHFEMWEGHDSLGADDDRKVDPYPYVTAARDAGRYTGPDGAGASQPPSSTPSATPPAPDAHDRVAGTNRVLTSVELSRAAFRSASAVVVAPAEVYPEALLAAPLAAALDAPVLLTWNHQAPDRDVLDPAVADEIDRLGASEVVIVGSTATIDAELESQLHDRTGVDDVRRIAGADRYALAGEVAAEVLAARDANDGGDVSPIVALGEHENPVRGWPDALAASAVAARQQVPILLTRGDRLPAATREVLTRAGIGEVRIAGGPVAIAEAVEDEIRALDRSTRRLAGADRYQTSLALAEEAMGSGASPAKVWVATGRNYPDALAAGRTVAALGDVLVLVDGMDRAGAGAVYDWLRDRAGAVDEVVAIGGTGVVTDAILEDLAVHANWPS